MDFKRSLAYGALFAVILMLWMAWQKDHPQTPQAAQTPATASTSSSSSSSSSSESSSGIWSTKPAAKHNVKSANQLVSVKTDALDLKINLIGGSVESAKLLKYPVSMHDKAPFTIFNNKADYFYAAESGFVNRQKANNPVHYTTAKKSYVLRGGQKSLNVDLTGEVAPGVKVVKEFQFSPDNYLIKVNYVVHNTSNKVWTGMIFSQLSRRWPLPATKSKSMLHTMSSYTGAAISTTEKIFDKVKFKNMASEPVNMNSIGGWAAMLQQYFLSAWVPNQKNTNVYYSRVRDKTIYSIGYAGPEMKLAPGEKASQLNKLYVGPEITDTLKKIAPHLEMTIDYGWLWFISDIIFWLMQKIHFVLGNWGWSIIAVTLFIKLIFYKLSATSYRSMARMRMLQPKITALKERFGDKKQEFSRAMMELYKKEKVNPMGGCLPIVIQIPVFIALYWVLLESVELRQAPFMLWIHDLAAPDPFYILPIIMGASMFVQQKLSPPPADPTQAKVMMFLPVIFTVFFLNFPSGLVLYWIVNNVLSILQQWYITRKIENETKSGNKSLKKKKA